MHVEAKSVLHQQVRVELNPGGSDTTAAHGLSPVKTETETDGINKGVKVRTHIYIFNLLLMLVFGEWSPLHN